MPRAFQHRVLHIGILLSLLLRAVCIAAGVAVLDAFNRVFDVFGAFLICTVIKVARDGGGDDEDDNAVIRAVQKVLPTSDA